MATMYVLKYVPTGSSSDELSSYQDISWWFESPWLHSQFTDNTNC